MPSPTVFIVDDDTGIRNNIPVLLESAGLQAECFASAEKFLKVYGPEREGCLLLDVRMPGMSGPELQEELARRNLRLPIIFLTGYAEIATGIEAMKQGAADFLTKPVNGALLLQRVQAALKRDREQRQADAAKHQFEERLRKLTDREREVLVLALSGMTNKLISTRLQISLRTIEGHRSRIFLKTGVRSLVELAQAAASQGVSLVDLESRSHTAGP